MARKIEQFPLAASVRYPWDEYLDGSIWELVRGEDYTAKTQTFLGNARSRAKRLGGTLRTRALRKNDSEVVVIQFHR